MRQSRELTGVSDIDYDSDSVFISQRRPPPRSSRTRSSTPTADLLKVWDRICCREGTAPQVGNASPETARVGNRLALELKKTHLVLPTPTAAPVFTAAPESSGHTSPLAANLEVSMSCARPTLNARIISSAGFQTQNTPRKIERPACLFTRRKTALSSDGRHQMDNVQIMLLPLPRPKRTFNKTASTARVDWPTRWTTSRPSAQVFRKWCLTAKY